jgi:WXG100 family type VII secretion target
MTDTTQVNYSEMEGVIKSLKAKEEEIMNVLKTTKSKVESLHDSQWVGQAADSFFNEMEQTVLPALSRLANALGTGGNVAQEIVSTIHQADEETQSYFNNIA